MKDDEVLVSVQNVSKKFCRDLKTSLWYGVKDLTSEFFGRSKDGELRPKEFYAVNDVSFELRRGECLGLIGHNGAGKSTLLKMLNGLIKPDKGTITMKGRIGALIELGAGFNPVLTGRENIYVNGQVLGFTRKEIDEKFDAIVEFSEIGDFIDTPVRNYSSGMKVRLGFSVAAQMEPDVLLIDEVLAVGDIGFQTKCFNRIGELLRVSSVIFVSHSMPMIGRMCNSLLLLEYGKPKFNGLEIAEGIEIYRDRYKDEELQVFGSGKVDLKKIELYPDGNKNISNNPIIPRDKDIIVDLIFSVDKSIKSFSIALGFYDKTLRSVAQTSTKYDIGCFSNDKPEYKVKAKLPNLFSPDKYSLLLNFFEDSNESLNYGETLASYKSIINFKITGSHIITYTPIQIRSKWELVD